MRQTVDPFIPISRPDKRPKPAVPSTPTETDRVVMQPSTAPPRHPRQNRRFMGALRLLTACTAIIGAGVLLQIAYAGEIMIGLYALWAFIRRGSSRTSFILALVSFGTILIMLFVRPDSLLMRNFALYAFLFLIVGTISLFREAHD